MTGKTQLTDTLVRKHVAVRGTMRTMTCRAAFDARCLMLKDKWAAFIGVAVNAGFLFEPAEQRATLRTMGVMA